MMARLRFALGAVTLLARQATAAIDFNYTGALTQTNNFASTILTCNNPLAVANATGIFKLQPGIAQGSTKQSNGKSFGAELRIGAVAAIPNGTIQVSFHVGTGTANFLDDTQTGYDACLLITDPSLINYNTLLRSVDDDGSGLQTFDTRCKAAIQDTTNNLAREVNRPSAQGGNDLTGVCLTIWNKIRASPPKECMPFYNSMSTWVLFQMPLTQPPNTQTSILNSACQSTGDDGAKLYNVLTLLSKGYSDNVYDVMVSVPVPMITVFMPIANGADTNKSVITDPWTEVTMVHVNHINNGSRPKSSWPAPNPVDYSSYDAYVASIERNNTLNSTSTASPVASSTGLGPGGIAGVVIGVIALLALAAALAFFCIRRRRRQRTAKHQRAVQELDGSGFGVAEKRMVMTDGGMHEMSPDSYKKSELASPSQPRHELPTGVVYGHEMDTDRTPIELPGDTPLKDKTRWHG